MHLLIPCAGVLSEAGLQATRRLQLPTLAVLLGRLAVVDRDEGDEFTLSPPHERALAASLGWPVVDGGLPWAAWQARALGLSVDDEPWGLLTPVHLRLGTEQASLFNPSTLALDESTSRALLDAVRDLFESMGFAVAWGGPLMWFVRHASLAGLRTASLDRVIGRNIDPWLPDQSDARPLRRLLLELQMALHAHPMNDTREAAGQLPVNGAWLSGCGALPASAPQAGQPAVDDRLRNGALDEDWPAWAAAWQALDSGPLATLLAALNRGEPVQLTLCGERHAVRLAPAQRRWWARLTGAGSPREPVALLESL